MPSRTASCYCGQLEIQVEGEPIIVGVCHCLACQQRTGSVFAALASFLKPYRVVGKATEFVRRGEGGSAFRFRFCPVCGSTVFHTEIGDDATVSVSVGAFADPSFPAPCVSFTTVVGIRGLTRRMVPCTNEIRIERSERLGSSRGGGSVETPAAGRSARVTLESSPRHTAGRS